MEGLSAEDVLELWEQGGGRTAGERALLLLARAHPASAPHFLASMTLGDREASLLALRTQTLGSRMDSLVDCPACSTTMEFAVDAHHLASPEVLTHGTVRDERNESRYSCEVDGWNVEFRLPTAGDVAVVGRSSSPNAARQALLTRCITVLRSASGEAADIARLPDSVEEALGTEIARLDPFVEFRTRLVCPECEHQWDTTLDVASFFWSEVTAMANRLIRDVAELAARFGWSEREILAMSARRRLAYMNGAGA